MDGNLVIRKVQYISFKDMWGPEQTWDTVQLQIARPWGVCVLIVDMLQLSYMFLFK